MLILGLKSASSCTHSAAIAATCIVNGIHCYNQVLNRRFKDHESARKGEEEIQKRVTLAAATGGYSPSSFGSTHSCTLSSLNFEVAYKNIYVIEISRA